MRSVLTALCLFASAAHAVPAQFTHQGRLLDADGVPLDGETTIIFRVTDSEMGGSALWEDTLTVLLNNGFYSAVLGTDEEGNPLDVEVLSQAPTWLELQLEGEGAMFPRTPIHSVPYATMATVAEEVSGGPVDASEVAVDGALVINDAGEWVGPAPTVNWADLEGIPEDFADGIDDDTDTDSDSFADLGVSCLDGDVPVWDGVVMAWGCGIDAVLTADEVDAIVADNGYAMESEVFSSSFLDLTDVPDGLDDGDDNTQLSESEVDGMVADNGYAMASEVFSRLYSDLVGIPEDLADGDDTLTEDEVDAMVSDDISALESDIDSDVAALLAEIGTLRDQVEALEEDAGSGSGTVMHGHYTAENSIELDALRGYTEVTGNLSINPGSTPTLEMLSSLTTVGGDLTVNHSSAFTNLDGLENLTTVGGTLSIRNNSALEDISALANLTEASTIYIRDNDALRGIGLSSLNVINEGILDISANPNLINLDDLNNLRSIAGGLNLYDNDSLENIDGLESLTEVGHNVAVHENPLLSSVEGLSSLTTITGYLRIENLDALTSLSGLESITDVERLTIEGNDSLCQSLVLAFKDALEATGWSGGPNYLSANADC